MKYTLQQSSFPRGPSQLFLPGHSATTNPKPGCILATGYIAKNPEEIKRSLKKNQLTEHKPIVGMRPICAARNYPLTRQSNLDGTFVCVSRTGRHVLLLGTAAPPNQSLYLHRSAYRQRKDVPFTFSKAENSKRPDASCGKSDIDSTAHGGERLLMRSKNRCRRKTKDSLIHGFKEVDAVVVPKGETV